MDYINATDSELEQLVQQKDINAICELGERYLYGKNGHEKQYSLAYKMFHKGEKQGDKRAYKGLGDIYHNGWYMIKNEELAKEYYQKAGEMIAALEQEGAQIDYDIACVQHADNIHTGRCNVYDNAGLLLEKKMEKLPCLILPAGAYLTAYHVGHWNSVQEAYARLTAYKKTQKLQTDDIYLEHYVVDNFVEDSIENFVTEISVRIR